MNWRFPPFPQEELTCSPCSNKYDLFSWVAFMSSSWAWPSWLWKMAIRDARCERAYSMPIFKTNSLFAWYKCFHILVENLPFFTVQPTSRIAKMVVRAVLLVVITKTERVQTIPPWTRLWEQKATYTVNDRFVLQVQLVFWPWCFADTIREEAFHKYVGWCWKWNPPKREFWTSKRDIPWMTLQECLAMTSLVI